MLLAKLFGRLVRIAEPPIAYWVRPAEFTAGLLEREIGFTFSACTMIFTELLMRACREDGSPPRRSATNFPRCHGRCFVRVQAGTKMLVDT